VITRIGRTWRTARHLRPLQIGWLVYRRLVPLTAVAAPEPADVRRRDGIGLLPRPGNAPLRADDGWTFTFLNTARTWTPSSLDWHPTDLPRLWRYNLHYFDYLLDDDCPLAARDALLDHWIAANPPGTRDAWEPYPTSLRIVNWIDYVVRTQPCRPPKPAWLASLYHQAAWLERNVEYHLLANHLLKNAVALTFAGAFFSRGDAERWWRLGTRLLAREACEQFLPDGGHFERSPMYHAIATQDLLDVINLLRHSPALAGELRPRLEDKAIAALDFLGDLLHPDGEIALFNDAAFGIALPPDVLRRYGEAVLGRPVPWQLHPENMVLIDRPDTGYFGCRRGGDYLIIDCGPIGPDYQPGHAHCDTLSFELSIAGRRVIVDSGVSGYDNDPLRHYVRSTAAHNTVRINGQEQSEIWSRFRVGRRAKSLHPKIVHGGSNGVIFRGSHDGFTFASPAVIHSREIRHDAGNGTWSITDRVEGGGAVTVESFLHFAPDLRVRAEGDRFVVSTTEGDGLAEIRLVGGGSVTGTNGFYCPRFGQYSENTGLCFSNKGLKQGEIRFEIGGCHEDLVRLSLFSA
jgi:uncharacterized heparinase superfamily protein